MDDSGIKNSGLNFEFSYEGKYNSEPERYTILRVRCKESMAENFFIAGWEFSVPD
jgi:hypothetical protein